MDDLVMVPGQCSERLGSVELVEGRLAVNGDCPVEVG